MSTGIQVRVRVGVGTSLISSDWSKTDGESEPGLSETGVQDTELILADEVAGGLYEVRACATTQTNGDTILVGVTYTDGVLGSSLTAYPINNQTIAGSAQVSGSVLIRVEAASDIRVAINQSAQVDTRVSATLRRVG